MNRLPGQRTTAEESGLSDYLLARSCASDRYIVAVRVGRNAVFLIFAASAVGAVLALLKPSEPADGGRSLSKWIEQFRNNLVDDVPSPGADAKRAEAEVAIRAIGSRAVPTLLSWARQKPPTWQYHVPLQVRWRIISFRDRFRLYGRDPFADAMTGFGILGTNAVAAVPKLAELLGDPDSYRSRQVMVALSHLGPEALPYVMAEMSKGGAKERWWYCRLLAEYLVPTINSTNQLPFLLDATRNEYEPLRSTASNAVWRMAPDLLTNAPAH